MSKTVPPAQVVPVQSEMMSGNDRDAGAAGGDGHQRCGHCARQSVCLLRERQICGGRRLCALWLLKWGSTLTNIAAGMLMAANVEVSPLAFPLFTAVNVTWAVTGRLMRETSLVTLNLVFLAINGFGCLRWLLV